MKVFAPQSAYGAKRDGRWEPLIAPVALATTPEAVEAHWTAFLLTDARSLPEPWSAVLREACDARLAEIEIEQAHREMDSIVGRIVREER